jgi:CRP-like cAMP-binding protein
VFPIRLHAVRTQFVPPTPATRSHPHNPHPPQNSLCNLLLFGRLDDAAQTKIAENTWERSVSAGEILIQEGEVGRAAAELYVVKTGKFEVLERRKDVNMRVNVKERGDVFGEVSLLYNCPRTATVAATTDAVVWVLERDVFRKYVQEAAEGEVGQIELFLNSVPLLNPLSREAKMQVRGAACGLLHARRPVCASPAAAAVSPF